MWVSRQVCAHYAPSEDTVSRKSRQLREKGNTRPFPSSYASVVTEHLKPVKRTERLGTVSNLGRAER